MILIKDIKSRIIDEYEEMRTKKTAQKNKRVEEVYKKFPELSEIAKEINLLGFENTKNILKNPQNAAELNAEFNKKLNMLVEKKKQFIKENGIDPDFDKVKYDCNACGDTGYLENGEKCACFKEKIIKNTYKSSNLSEVMKDMCFENFSLDFYENSRKEGISERENMEFILKSAKRFCDDFDEYKRNILFYGPPGLGKTFISVSVARELINRGKTVIYISATRLFSCYDDYKFGRDNTLDEFLDDIYNADLLIIDDLGTEYISKLSVPFLFDLVNDRILKDKKIIINTNLFPDALEKAYSVRFMSRVYEYFDVFKFSGKDIRIQKQYL